MRFNLCNLDFLGHAVDLMDLVGVDVCVKSATLVDHLLSALKRNVSVNFLVVYKVNGVDRSIVVVTDLNHFF